MSQPISTFWNDFKPFLVLTLSFAVAWVVESYIIATGAPVANPGQPLLARTGAYAPEYTSKFYLYGFAVVGWAMGLVLRKKKLHRCGLVDLTEACMNRYVALVVVFFVMSTLASIFLLYGYQHDSVWHVRLFYAAWTVPLLLLVSEINQDEPLFGLMAHVR